MALFSKKPEEPKPAKPQVPGANAAKAKEPKAKAPATKAPSGPKETTYFGKNLKITGNVSGDGDLIILGRLEGEFNLKGKLQIAEPAEIVGFVKANDVAVKGNISGNISATQKVHLDQTARVKGQIACPKLSVEEGASFDGEVKMSAQAIPKPSPAVNTAPIPSKGPQATEIAKGPETAEKAKVTS
jgi:cytoskeletal protein CcmA (bactofilin family)